MIRHAVLLQFKDTLTEKDIEAVFTALKDLQNVKDMPKILSFTWGPYRSKEGLNKGFTHMFTMKFKDEKDRDDYLVHPEHMRVAKQVVLPNLVDGENSVIAFDYEKESTKALVASKQQTSYTPPMKSLTSSTKKTSSTTPKRLSF